MSQQKIKKYGGAFEEALWAAINNHGETVAFQKAAELIDDLATAPSPPSHARQFPNSPVYEPTGLEKLKFSPDSPAYHPTDLERLKFSNATSPVYAENDLFESLYKSDHYTD